MNRDNERLMGIIVTVTTWQWSDIFTKVTKSIIVLKISIAKARLLSHQSDKLYDVSTQFISSQPNLPPSIRVEGRGGEEGWVATGGLCLPCQEKGVRTLALHSKSWISSLRKINEGNELKWIFLCLHSLRSDTNPQMRQRFASC